MVEPDTYFSGHGGSNINPLHSLANASDMVVHKFSEAHQAHWFCVAHPVQSKLSPQFGNKGHELDSKDQEEHCASTVGPDSVPFKHCNVDSQNPHSLASVHDWHRPTDVQ